MNAVRVLKGHTSSATSLACFFLSKMGSPIISGDYDYKMLLQSDTDESSGGEECFLHRCDV